MFEIEFYPIFTDDYLDEKPMKAQITDNYDEVKKAIEKWKDTVDCDGLIECRMNDTLMFRKIHRVE